MRFVVEDKLKEEFYELSGFNVFSICDCIHYII